MYVRLTRLTLLFTVDWNTPERRALGKTYYQRRETGFFLFSLSRSLSDLGGFKVKIPLGILEYNMRLRFDLSFSVMCAADVAREKKAQVRAQAFAWNFAVIFQCRRQPFESALSTAPTIARNLTCALPFFSNFARSVSNLMVFEGIFFLKPPRDLFVESEHVRGCCRGKWVLFWNIMKWNERKEVWKKKENIKIKIASEGARCVE